MSITKPHYDARLVEEHDELHFSCGGFWDVETMEAFFAELANTLQPIFKARKTYSVLGDFTDAMPQDRATTQVSIDNLKNSQKYGLRRIAIVNASALMKLQYKRMSEGLDVEFFDTKPAALAWLRA